jgi:hypothetical protein
MDYSDKRYALKPEIPRTQPSKFQLNNNSKRINYASPVDDEHLDAVAGKNILSITDGRSIFWQLTLHVNLQNIVSHFSFKYDEHLDAVAGKNILSITDARSIFWQLAVHVNSPNSVAFFTQIGTRR